MTKLEPTKRGFMRGAFTDLYNSKCSIQESSLAGMSAIWLGVDTDFEGRNCTRMHLSRDMAAALIPLLQHFVETGELPPEANDD